MNYTPAREVELEPRQNDHELEDILQLGQGGVDEETRRFIEEVLKFVPSERPPEIRVFTSHRGAGDAS